MARRHTMVRSRSTRKSLWLQFVPISTTVTAGGAAIAFSLNAAALALRSFTVIRSHFEVMLLSDQESVIEQQVGAVGLAVVSDEAVAVGVTAVPTPLTQLGSSLWFVNQLMFGEESRLATLALPPVHYSIDSKAMRKVEVGSDIIVVLESSTIGSAGAIDFNIGGRVLIKTN